MNFSVAFTETSIEKTALGIGKGSVGVQQWVIHNDRALGSYNEMEELFTGISVDFGEKKGVWVR